METVQTFRTFGWGRAVPGPCPALFQAVMILLGPLVLSSSMFCIVLSTTRCRRSDAAGWLRADCPSGKAPTARVHRLISRRMFWHARGFKRHRVREITCTWLGGSLRLLKATPPYSIILKNCERVGRSTPPHDSKARCRLHRELPILLS